MVEAAASSVTLVVTNALLGVLCGLCLLVLVVTAVVDALRRRPGRPEPGADTPDRGPGLAGEHAPRHA